MTLRRISLYLLVAVTVALVFRWGLSPLRTQLPRGTMELSSVEAKFQRLTVEEQALVRGYLQRSKGEYFPAGSADPDAPPLTARTFGDAITLQRRFLANLDVTRGEVRAREAQRDAQLAPLRAVLQLEMVDRRMTAVTGPFGAARRDSRGAEPALPNEHLEAITRFRVRNVSGRVVQSFAGAAGAYQHDSDALTPRRLSGCYIDEARPLAPGATLDVGCGNLGPDVDGNAYLAMPDTAIRLDWMPRRIAFADGTELKYDGN